MEQFLELCRQAWEQKAEVEKIREELKKANASLVKTKASVDKWMEETELEKQHVPGFGTLYRQKKFSIKVPKTPEDKLALFNWISANKGEDVLFALQSIASPTVNALYKEELEIAKKEGNVDFNIPGISGPKLYWDIGMRKG